MPLRTLHAAAYGADNSDCDHADVRWCGGVRGRCGRMRGGGDTDGIVIATAVTTKFDCAILGQVSTVVC